MRQVLHFLFLNHSPILSNISSIFNTMEHFSSFKMLLQKAMVVAGVGFTLQ
jgi:hypothetical protein